MIILIGSHKTLRLLYNSSPPIEEDLFSIETYGLFRPTMGYSERVTCMEFVTPTE